MRRSYLTWLEIVPHIPRSSRYTLGDRIENKFIDLLESVYKAYYSRGETKIAHIVRAIAILDILKFLLQTAWEARLVSNGKLSELSEKLMEIGKMLGGWKNSQEKKTPTQ